MSNADTQSVDAENSDQQHADSEALLASLELGKRLGVDATDLAVAVLQTIRAELALSRYALSRAVFAWVAAAFLGLATAGVALALSVYALAVGAGFGWGWALFIIMALLLALTVTMGRLGRKLSGQSGLSRSRALLVQLCRALIADSTPNAGDSGTSQ